MILVRRLLYKNKYTECPATRKKPQGYSIIIIIIIIITLFVSLYALMCFSSNAYL
jgi:flagellar basal body-associated protein FliL